jgi:hypothetical protein
MNTTCDNCRKKVGEVGKLFKYGFLTLCKTCREKIKRNGG